MRAHGCVGEGGGSNRRREGRGVEGGDGKGGDWDTGQGGEGVREVKVKRRKDTEMGGSGGALTGRDGKGREGNSGDGKCRARKSSYTERLGRECVLAGGREGKRVGLLGRATGRTDNRCSGGRKEKERDN